MDAFAGDLQFEWDDDKARLNVRKHRVSFLTAAAIFANKVFESVDDRFDYDEVRIVAFGRVGTEIFRVVYTMRGENIVRIISAQKASRDDRENYHRQTFA